MQPEISYDAVRTYCHIRNVKVQFGSVQKGFVTVDADGRVNDRAHTSFAPAGEMVQARAPRSILPEAEVFRVVRADTGEVRDLGRAEFSAEVEQVARILTA